MVEGISQAKPAVFTRRLAVMARFTQRLMVQRIPKQFQIPAMRYDMIHNHRRHQPRHLQAFPAQWIVSQKREAVFLPARSVQLMPFGRSRGSTRFRRMCRTARSTEYSVSASRESARLTRRAWHARAFHRPASILYGNGSPLPLQHRNYPRNRKQPAIQPFRNRRPVQT